MRIFLSLLLFLLWASVASAQVTVGGAYTKEEIAKAKAEEAKARAIINAADGVKLQLQVDQFECVHPKKDAPSTSPLLWITNDESIVERIEIDAGTPLIFRGVRAGDTVKKTHYFSAQPFRWAVLIGSKEGAAKLVAVQNGPANQAPGIYGEVNVTVGKGPKPPDPPEPDVPLSEVEKALKGAYAKDVAAGKGDKTHVVIVQEVFRTAASRLPDSATVGQLYTMTSDAAARAGLPAVDKSLTNLRRAIAVELDKRLPTDADKQLTVEDKNKVTASFNLIADSLEVILK